MRVFEDKLLRKTFRPTKGKNNGIWGRGGGEIIIRSFIVGTPYKLYYCDMHESLSVVSTAETMGLQWGGHVVVMLAHGILNT
jgi:hypothetical protein